MGTRAVEERAAAGSVRAAAVGLGAVGLGVAGLATGAVVRGLVAAAGVGLAPLWMGATHTWGGGAGGVSSPWGRASLGPPCISAVGTALLSGVQQSCWSVPLWAAQLVAEGRVG